MTDYERIFTDEVDPSGLSRRLAEAMAAARAAADPSIPPPVADVATGVAAPAMIGFSLWIAQRAGEIGLERMYFAGRNGRLAMIAYDELPASLTAAAPSTYIQVSRNVVRRASAGVDIQKWIECGHATPTSFLRQHAHTLPLYRLLDRAFIDPERHRPLIEARGLRLDQPLPDNASTIWRDLFDDPAIRASIANAVGPSLPVLQEWFDRHGLFDHERVGLVDVGWRGQQSAMIDAVVGHRCATRVRHLHLGRNIEEPLFVPSQIERWLMDIDQPLVRSPVALFETLMATSERALVGLERSSAGEVEPVLREGTDPVGTSSHVGAVQALVAAVARTLAPTLTTADLAVDLRAPVRQATLRFWEHPTVAEAAYWAAVPYEKDGSGQLVIPLGAPVRARELPRIARTRSLPHRQWSEGALMASSPGMRTLLQPIQRFFAKPKRARSDGGTSVSSRG